MSYINVEALRAETLIQSFKIKRNRLHLTAIRPFLYVHNDPPGTFILTLKDGPDTIATAEFTSAEIIANSGFTPGQYHKGFFTIPINAVLHHDREYTIELSSSGYVYNGLSYLGWIKEFENLTNEFIDNTIWTFHQKPFGYQLWGY